MKRPASIVAALALGCAGPRVQHITSLACPEQHASRSAPLADQTPPVPRGFFLPPLPPPAGVRHEVAVLDLIVDSTGTVVPDSITVCGLSDTTYARKVAEAAAKIPFEPARAHGVPLRSHVQIGYDFRSP